MFTMMLRQSMIPNIIKRLHSAFSRVFLVCAKTRLVPERISMKWSRLCSCVAFRSFNLRVGNKRNVESCCWWWVIQRTVGHFLCRYLTYVEPVDKETICNHRSWTAEMLHMLVKLPEIRTLSDSKHDAAFLHVCFRWCCSSDSTFQISLWMLPSPRLPSHCENLLVCQTVND